MLQLTIAELALFLVIAHAAKKRFCGQEGLHELRPAGTTDPERQHVGRAVACSLKAHRRQVAIQCAV